MRVSRFSPPLASATQHDRVQGQAKTDSVGAPRRATPHRSPGPICDGKAIQKVCELAGHGAGQMVALPPGSGLVHEIQKTDTIEQERVDSVASAKDRVYCYRKRQDRRCIQRRDQTVSK